MNGNCRRPIALRAASVMAVVGLGLAVARTAHADMLDGLEWVFPIMLMLFVGGPIIIGLVAWRALRAASRSSQPREDGWAAWSLILGVVSQPISPLVFFTSPLGPFAIWAGIRAYRMGGSKRMAVWGIVLGAVGTLWGGAFLLHYVFSLL